MFVIQEESLEWALNHLKKYPSSDFFPQLFEFEAISHNWIDVKKYILGIDLERYSPKSPLTMLALKQNKNFRVVHQLDPIDSIIYTALIYEISDIIESFRMPEDKRVACSYRIEIDTDGSFFKSRGGWSDFTNRTEDLIEKYKNGYVLICDITDFYNQIYTHKINSIICEAGGRHFEEHAKIIEKFILGLDSKTSRGIPVGPEASIILSEAIMADIDRKISSQIHGYDFVQYVDDLRIFFEDEKTALLTLHELTKYLHSEHRLVFSSIKTSIRKTHDFAKNHFRNEEKEETMALIDHQEKLALAAYSESIDISPYDFFLDIDRGKFVEIFDQIGEREQTKILTDTYLELFKKEIEKDKPEFSVLKRILKQCAVYRIRCLVPIILINFDNLIPIIRESCIYLSRVLNAKTVLIYKDEFNSVFQSDYCKLPYVNMWIAFLLQQRVFKNFDLSAEQDCLISLRDKALLAKLNNDVLFVKDHKNDIDTLSPWDKRAVLFSAEILPKDGAIAWLGLIAGRDDILDRSIAKYVKSLKKN